MKREKVYWGSVQFFRHLILLSLAALMVAAASSIIILNVQNAALRKELALTEQASLNTVPSSEDSAQAAPPTTAPPPETTLAPVQPTYTALLPDFYTDVAAPCSVDTEKTVYLTFDDGPSPRTDEILEILKRYGVKATFFVVGRESEEDRERMRQIVAAGHTLGMHSFSHDYKTIYAGIEEFLSDQYRVYQLIYDATGQYPQIFRFPGGSINGYDRPFYQELIGEMTRRGFVYFDWNVVTGDAEGTSQPAALINHATKDCDYLRRAVILMHDSVSKHGTVEALPAIIEAYRDAGFTFEVLTPEVVPVIFGYSQSS